MNSVPSSSKNNSIFEDDEIFDDSTFLANLERSFKEKTSKLSESNLNNSTLNVSALCCDEEISGYDKLTGKTWIYPTNYPVRDYQFNIINAALLKNTLVSLPTGLGKTFIAAVIMYNFYRWYPLGKIVFTAPTRPLIAQQIEACYNIIGIPPGDTVEMTGHMQANTRKMHWQSKRVFFATPQVIYNDIKSQICPANKIRCLVIDEAHRARGNYAFCQIISTLDDLSHRTYRVLALSATPGSKVDDVITVVKNLHIAHLELRTENCIDVAPYSHVKKITNVIIQLGPELTQLRNMYVEILDGYARRLKQLNILPQNIGNLSKGRIVMLYKEFQGKERGSRHPQHNYIMKDFTILIALYHGLELLTKHGSRVFLNFFDEHPEKSWIQADDKLTGLLERLRDDLGINPLALDRSILPDGTVPEIPKNLSFGHPKFYKLKEIMLEHFSRAKKFGQTTKAIVFCEYRESVNLVHCLLLQCRPLIVPQMFVGQGSAGKEGKAVVSQKQQLRVMRLFREGACNALVATCVAEEGLDVGSVDLILCFDVSTRSPVRLVQRCGRTGRERGGQVYILVTEGREHQTLLECMRQRDGLNKKVLHSKEVERNLYATNPRMVPHDFTPQCQKMYITVAKKPEKTKKDETTKKGQKDLRSMLLGRASTSGAAANKEIDANTSITEDEFNELFPNGYHESSRLADPTEYLGMDKKKITEIRYGEDTSHLKLSTWLEWQRTLQKTVNIEHSSDTEILSALLQYSDAKRFDMPPSTQNPSFNTQKLCTQTVLPVLPAKAKQAKKKPKVQTAKSPNKKDGDIRALFSTATKSTKNYTKLINDLGIPNDGSIPTKLVNLLVDLKIEATTSNKKCYVCENICDCKILLDIRNKRKPVRFFSLKEIRLPEINLVDDFDADAILKCAVHDETVPLSPIFDTSMHSNIDVKDHTNNFDLELDLGSSDGWTSPNDIIEVKALDSSDANKNFDIGDIDDIFAESSPEEVIEKQIVEIKDEAVKPKEALGFFGLDSIEDIFADYDDSVEVKDKPSNEINEIKNHEISKPNKENIGILEIKDGPSNIEKEIVVDNTEKPNKENIDIIDENIIENPVSPSILSGSVKTRVDPTSPILCSQVRRFQLSTKKSSRPLFSTPNSTKKQLVYDISERSDFKTPNLTPKPNITNNTSNVTDRTNKSMFTITQLVDMINTTDSKTVSNSKANECVDEDDRSTSPILLTQAVKRKIELSRNKSPILTSQVKKQDSLIILESDSESDNDFENTQIYEVDSKVKKDQFSPLKSPQTSKRKFKDDAFNASPYFNKKPKLDSQGSKALTLQEKVLAAITKDAIIDKNSTKNDSLDFMVSLPTCFSQKENKNPQFLDLSDEEDDMKKEKEHVNKNNLQMLQMFKRDSKVNNPKSIVKEALKLSPIKNNRSQKRRLSFNESDDDFEDNNTQRNKLKCSNREKKKQPTNHKVRKKKKHSNGFLDLEADISDADGSHSGDELSDDSIGSIVDFICDDNETAQEDMHAHYLRSIKSPVNGKFKIPDLPQRCKKEEIFSQFVEEDSYEMDSFCVDSHIGLTQVNETSELELAELLLVEERRAKKKSKFEPALRVSLDNDQSLAIKSKARKKRQISSDSDESS